MKVADLLQKRQGQWQELETYCQRLNGAAMVHQNPATLARFAALYRAACADLALADAYQLPPGTVQYLHQLVARAHNQLYRSGKFRWRQWRHELLVALPRRLFQDRYIRLAFLIFWGIFFA